jgi:hypothetical protein
VPPSQIPDFSGCLCIHADKKIPLCDGYKKADSSTNGAFVMPKDSYSQMRKEIASLWKILRDAPRHLPDSIKEIRNKLLIVNRLAGNIGGRTQRDAERLEMDVGRFLQGELSRSQIESMFEDALKLEQDTREL